MTLVPRIAIASALAALPLDEDLPALHAALDAAALQPEKLNACPISWPGASASPP